MTPNSVMKSEAKTFISSNSSLIYKLFIPYTILNLISDFTYQQSVQGEYNVSVGGGSVFVNLLILFLLFGIIKTLLPALRKAEDLTDKSKLGFFEVLTTSYSNINFNTVIHLVALTFIQGFIILVGFLLFIIPGVILSFGFSQSVYILYDKLEKGQDIKYFEILSESMNLMKGHKFEYFILNISFFLWYILVAITFGIAGFYVYPYVQTTLIIYYKNLISERSERYNHLIK